MRRVLAAPRAPDQCSHAARRSQVDQVEAVGEANEATGGAAQDAGGFNNDPVSNFLPSST